MPASHSSSPSEAAQRYALLEQVQRNVLEAQRHFQDTLAQSHLAFLQTSEAILRQISGGGGGHVNGHSTPPLPVKTFEAPPVAMATVPAVPAAPRALPRPPVTPVAAVPVVVAPREVAPVQPVARVTLPEPVSAPAVSAVPAMAERGAASDYQSIIVDTIASCTGYPPDMIELDMELEAGLGIDSIKKVEIFAALQGKIPALANADASQVSGLGTIRAILDFTRGLTGQAAVATAKN